VGTEVKIHVPGDQCQIAHGCRHHDELGLQAFLAVPASVARSIERRLGNIMAGDAHPNRPGIGDVDAAQNN